MRMVVVWLFALLLSAPSLVSAQAPQAFEDLALRVNIGDRLRVEDAGGVTTTGRLTRLTRQEIAIHTDGGERRFTSDAVREVALQGHSLGKAALVGAGVGAVLGVVAMCSHEGGADCAVIGSLAAAPIGAGVGLAVGALVPRMRIVYRAPDSRTGAPPTRAAGGQGSLLDDLGLRVNLDDELRVEDKSGVTSTGRLTRLTADEITIHTDAGDRHFTHDAVRHVAVRRHPLRIAVLIGSGAGVAAGAVAACSGPDREECADASIMAGALGAGLGLAVGALTHRTTTVYGQAKQGTLVMPVISRRAVGVRVRRYW